MALTRIEKTLAEHTDMLRRLQANQTGRNAYGDTELEDLVPVPIQEDQNWEALMASLTDVDFNKTLVWYYFYPQKV